jgi:hypothetical protein
MHPISMAEFYSWQPTLKLIVHDHARRFAAVELSDSRQAFAISWRSDTIEPVLETGSEGETWLGVDQRAACVSSDGRIVASLGLASPLLDIKCFAKCAAVLCENEAVVFNRDYSIRGIFGFREFPQSLLEKSGGLFVVFEDGHEERIG